jgi:hypothetical protein
VLVSLLVLAAPACDVRPLTARELYGAGGAGGGGGGAGTVVDGSASPDAVATPDGSSAPDIDGGTDTVPADTAPEAPTPACGQACAVDQFCNEATGHCAPRTGVGMLSGQVVDACSGNTISAQVGIAGQSLCSVTGKGAYFFTQLPLGDLWLSAHKVGYQRFGMAVNIVPGGVIQEIRLERVGGCDAPAPDPGGCTCTGPTCPR